MHYYTVNVNSGKMKLTNFFVVYNIIDVHDTSFQLIELVTFFFKSCDIYLLCMSPGDYKGEGPNR